MPADWRVRARRLREAQKDGYQWMWCVADPALPVMFSFRVVVSLTNYMNPRRRQQEIGSSQNSNFFRFMKGHEDDDGVGVDCTRLSAAGQREENSELVVLRVSAHMQTPMMGDLLVGRLSALAGWPRAAGTFVCVL
jgi:hypothetical protein